MPSQAFNLLARAYKTANDWTGEEIIFRGETIRAVLQPIAPSFDLEVGGFTQGGEFNCQILKESVSTPPQDGERLIYRGRSFLIKKEIREDKSHTAHLVTITPGSKQ